MRTTLTGAFLFLLSMAGIAQMKEADVSGIKNKYLDIPYASVSEAQKLDIYLPDEGEGPFPVILSIHGGAFLAGDKRDGQVTPMLRGLERGYAVVSINYRLSGEATWPAQIHDCKAAVRWVRANAAKYKLDPGRIAAWGGSAGGHLSAMLGTSRGVEKLEGPELGNAEQSSRVQAVVDWFGPTDFLAMDGQLQETGVENPMQHSVPDSPESLLLGENLEDAPALVEEANPETYVSSDDPPFFIQHGIEDNLVPYQGSVLLGRKLGKAIGFEKVYLELFPATGHGGQAFHTEENLHKIFSFLDKHLKGHNPFEKQTGFLEVDGSRLRYVVEGEGLPCLVIGSSVYYPKTFSDNLRKHLKMYFVDLKWFAKDYAPENLDSVDIASIVQDVEEIRQKLGLEKPLVMGHSIHGTIAMEYAKKHPGNISGVVAVGSPSEWGNATYDKKAVELWETASEERKALQEQNWGKIKEIDRLTGKEEAAAEYHVMSPQYWYNPRYDARWLWDGMTVHSEVARHLFTRVFKDYNMFDPAVPIPVPVLVVLGKYDYVIPYTLWKPAYERIPDFMLILFEKSGHTPQLEEGGRFDQVLIDWINSKLQQ